MDEMQLVRARADEVPASTPAELAPVRARLMAAIEAEAAEPARPGRRFPSRRRWWAAAVVLGTAAAASVVVAALPAGPAGPAPAAADPVRILRSAAAAALKLPATPPRPDQFVYTKSQTAERTREAWISADGAHAGLVRQDGGEFALQACRNGVAVVSGANDPKANGTLEACTPVPGYRANLPVTADAMLAYLNRNHSGNKGDVNAIGKDVLALVSEVWVSPQSRAALFEAATKIPGLTAVDHVTDGVGRPGVGITWPVPSGSADGAQPEVIVFDATSYAYLGSPTQAVTGYGIVDHPGDRP